MNRPNHNSDILLLLKDIKEMLAGIALILVGGFAMMSGSVIFFVGIILIIAGAGVVYQGYRAHIVVENDKGAENAEE